LRSAPLQTPAHRNARAGFSTRTRARQGIPEIAKSYAEPWEREARTGTDEHEAGFSARLKAGHWRIIEKEIRALALDSERTAMMPNERG
jgi:hypothetical protein